MIADASGHGLGPAFLATTARSYLRAAALQGTDAHEMLTYVNWLLTTDLQSGHFVTLFCCQLDPERSSFAFAAAGQPAYFLPDQGTPKVIQSTSIPLGVRDDEVFQLSNRQLLQVGDIILMITDGAVEASRPDRQQFFGIERVLRTVQEQREGTAMEIVAAIHKAVSKFAAPGYPQDDITIVIVKKVA